MSPCTLARLRAEGRRVLRQLQLRTQSHRVVVVVVVVGGVVVAVA
jgi:hypothetical protein